MSFLSMCLLALVSGEDILVTRAAAGPPPDYVALALSPFDRYAKDARRSRINMVEGSNAPGVKVGGDRRHRWSHVHYVHGRWWLTFTFDDPPDALANGATIKLPWTVKVRAMDDTPIDVTATVAVRGIQPGPRADIHALRVFREGELGEPTIEKADSVIVPRLDWDDGRITIDYVLKDSMDTQWVVGRFIYNKDHF